MSDDADQEHFADGITEDLITGLSRIRWLFVIARNSTFQYKGKHPDVRLVGRSLVSVTSLKAACAVRASACASPRSS